MSFPGEIMALLPRWYELRKVGQCKPLIQIGYTLWTFDPAARWDGLLDQIDATKLRQMIAEGEQNIERKKVCREIGDASSAGTGRPDSRSEVG